MVEEGDSLSPHALTTCQESETMRCRAGNSSRSQDPLCHYPLRVSLSPSPPLPPTCALSRCSLASGSEEAWWNSWMVQRPAERKSRRRTCQEGDEGGEGDGSRGDESVRVEISWAEMRWGEKRGSGKDQAAWQKRTSLQRRRVRAAFEIESL